MGRRADSTHGGTDGGAEPSFTPKRAKNAVKVAKVVLPAAGATLAPLAVRAAGAVREAYDRYRARQLGVEVTDLPEFTGRGGALLARIAGAADGLSALAALPARTGDDTASSARSEDDPAFVRRSRATLDQLTASVRAAEHMPAPRRRAAHRAVAAELDALETELLDRLGVAGR
ncbi:DUF6474 family protein [Saccharomonospora iraqiensis]|uniref:DUF6474 family protein n=1 Tax=Saccharomonospora iraqiensis TaxID=52698 RepID=UPI00022DED1C|nr:DUF6474 family protein [Saccharomonospora iraqiensis]